LDGVHLHCGWSIRTSVVLSGNASRHTSVTDFFDRESFNSVEQTFTVVMVSFMIAPSLFSMSEWGSYLPLEFKPERVTTDRLRNWFRGVCSSLTGNSADD
jgi:hypothetical protein